MRTSSVSTFRAAPTLPAPLPTTARRRAAKLSSHRGWLAAALGGSAIVLAVAINLQPPATPISLADGPEGTVVESIAVGTLQWAEGVRPGMVAQRWESSDGYFAEGIDVLIDDHRFGISLGQMAPDAWFVLVGIVLAAGAVLLRLARLPGLAIAATGGVGLALAPLGPQIGLPGALPVMLLPLAVALTATYIPDRRLRRRADIAGIAAMATAIAVFVAPLVVEPPTWSLVWSAPLAVGLLMAAVGEFLAVRWRLRHLAPEQAGRLRGLAAAAVPLAVESRIAGVDHERSRLAIELHNRVLPSVDATIRALRGGGSPDEAAERMGSVALELRDLMQRQETVSLEIGGLAEALRADVETTQRYEIPVTFQAWAGARRPPAAIELAAYRVGQAAIDNALRHSGADLVEVSVTSADDQLELIICDDGVGLDATAELKARRRGRIGLSQMRLRAEAVGAALDIEPHRPSGTEIRFRWVR